MLYFKTKENTKKTVELLLKIVLYLAFELTKQDWGTTFLPNARITASFTFWITSLKVLKVLSTPFLSPTKTHVHWVSIRWISAIKARGKD